jgi:TFIIF-interacting CTD phosphatase-like protein
VDRLDTLRLVQYRLFRQHCTVVNGGYVKDLSKLERNLKDVIILDVINNNVEQSYFICIEQSEWISNSFMVS